MTTQRLSSDSAWAVEECAAVALNDRRLNRRCQVLAGVLEHQPTMPLHQACEDWASTQAAYRCMDNPKVSPASLLDPHGQRTLERLSAHAVVLAVQDTTFLNYTAHPQTTGLGEIGTNAQHPRGFGLHTTWALTPPGLPLGILTQTVFTRPLGASIHTASARRTLPIEEKESYRWLAAFQQPITLTPNTIHRVTGCDREADVDERFVLAHDRQASLWVRASADRSLADDKVTHLWAKVERQRRVGKLTVAITGNQTRAARHATVTSRFCRVTLQPPTRPHPPQMPPVTRTAILVRAEHPPATIDEPIEGLLLTNTAVSTFVDAVRVVGWDCCRWPIEVDHQILKSGYGKC